jgi:hemoglobin-like flavoprotein
VYGVKDAHYATVAEALLDTLKHALGDEFDDETREAWTAVYSLMASVMQMGARDMAQAQRDPAMLHQRVA